MVWRRSQRADGSRPSTTARLLALVVAVSLVALSAPVVVPIAGWLLDVIAWVVDLL